MNDLTKIYFNTWIAYYKLRGVQGELGGDEEKENIMH